LALPTIILTCHPRCPESRRQRADARNKVLEHPGAYRIQWLPPRPEASDVFSNEFPNEWRSMVMNLA